MFWQILATADDLPLLCFPASSFLTSVRADDPESGQSKVATDEITKMRSMPPKSMRRSFTPCALTSVSLGRTKGNAVGRDDSYLRPEDRRYRISQAQEQSEEDPEDTPDEPTEADEKRLTGLGSGVIVSADGMVITNNHVIRDAKRVVVKLADETEIRGNRSAGRPRQRRGNLKISPEVAQEGFACTELADSDAVEIGDWVLAIGSPFRLEATVSAGIISAKNRSLKRINRGRLIQTDAAINPGNSGGPLIDSGWTRRLRSAPPSQPATAATRELDLPSPSTTPSGLPMNLPSMDASAAPRWVRR